jgi:hypothetical protein
VRHSDWPELFFWGGRPHWHPDWNRDFPPYAARAGSFVVGDTHGWTGMDDQHYGNNSLRAAYELTGDAYLRDLLVAHQSLVVWNYMTRWAESTSAERAARLMKEAILLWIVEDDGPTSAELRRRTIEKNRVYRRIAEESVAAWGVPAIATVRDDARVTLTVEHPGQDVGFGWQTGFHMEYQRLAIHVGWEPETARAVLSLYLDATERAFFAPDGAPATYVLMSDPSIRSYGGIGESWWSGWALAARAMPEHSGSAFLERTFVPRLRGALEPGTPWADSDRWRSFE